MKKSNLYYALLIKFGTMEAAAKALGTKPETLQRRTTGETNIPLPFAHKVIKVLGIENNSELINHLFF